MAYAASIALHFQTPKTRCNINEIFSQKVGYGYRRGSRVSHGQPDPVLTTHVRYCWAPPVVKDQSSPCEPCKATRPHSRTL
eukprot:364787-Chlamydomonas_euryale.AAC.6